MATSDIKKGPLYVDSVTGNVGLGTGSPSYKLDVFNSTTDTGSQLRVKNTHSAVGADAVVNIDGYGASTLKLWRNGIEEWKLERITNSDNLGLYAYGGAVSGGTGAGLIQFWDYDSGNVGIGESNPEQKLTVSGGAVAKLGSFNVTDDNNSNATGNPLSINYSTLQLRNNYSGAAPSANGTKVTKLGFSTVTSGGYSANASITCLAEGTGYNSGAMAFNTGSDSSNLETERMRITSGGQLLVGTTDTSPFNNTSTVGTSISGGELQLASLNGEAAYINRCGSDGRAVNFRKNGTFVGGINVTASGTTYESNSDYRLKTAVSYSWDATTRLKQLKPARFEWIVDGDDAVPVDGFLAHEVQGIVPEAISGTKDAVDDDGNPEYQGIDQSKLVPLLVKTIQELEARIAALEAN